MNREAKFSVVLPSGSLSTSQLAAFEETCHRYGLALHLPLRANNTGDTVAATSLSLRDAQLLRRQIAGLGYSVDVVGETMKTATRSPKLPDTVVVGRDSYDAYEPGDPVSDITTDAWSSLEVPAMDLDLNDGGQLEESAKWSGDNWLRPDESKTLSINAQDILKAAKLHEAQANAAPAMRGSDAKPIAIPGITTVSTSSQRNPALSIAPPRPAQTPEMATHVVPIIPSEVLPIHVNEVKPAHTPLPPRAPAFPPPAATQAASTTATVQTTSTNTTQNALSCQSVSRHPTGAETDIYADVPQQATSSALLTKIFLIMGVFIAILLILLIINLIHPLPFLSDLINPF
ncbi:MAG: hypothetical protein FWC40_05635 [Proteobacteria bacterium]|nr:hypothetical protein [Pseudomonadota bacterium]